MKDETTVSQSLQPFNFKGHPLRIFPTEDGLSFRAVAQDIANILGYASAKDALRSVPEKHKGRHSVPTPGGEQQMLCVDEAGFYRAVLRSDKPEAEPFIWEHAGSTDTDRLGNITAAVRAEGLPPDPAP